MDYNVYRMDNLEVNIEMQEIGRREKITTIAKKFAALDELDKAYITGYIAGKDAERQKWEKRKDKVNCRGSGR